MTNPVPSATSAGSAFGALAGSSSRRGFLASAGLSALSLSALAACGGGGSSSGTPSSAGASSAGASSAPAAGASSVAPGTYGKISLQLSWIKNIEFAGEFFADSKGYYKEAGFESVELVTGPVASADAQVLAGKATVGLSAPDATGRLISDSDAPLKIIGSTFQKNPFCILSLKEGKPIPTIADLAGKTIGIQAGTNQSIFEGLLKANKVDASTFKTVTVQFDIDPLTSKRVDGFMAYLTNEPFLAQGKGFTPVTLSFADNGLPLTAETFVVKQETIDSDRAMLKAFLKAEIKGWNDAIADPEGGAKLATDTYGKSLKLDLAEQAKEIKAQSELVVTEDTKKNGLFTLTDDFVAKIMTALGLVGIDLAPEDLFDLSLLEEVYTENPDLIVG